MSIKECKTEKYHNDILLKKHIIPNNSMIKKKNEVLWIKKLLHGRGGANLGG